MYLEKDITIIGGGLIGSALAIALRHHNFNIGVVDRVNLPDILNPVYDGRTLAIAYGSRLILEQWGIWQNIEEYTQPIQEIRASSPSSGSYIDYKADQATSHPMGYIIEIRYLRRALFQMLGEAGNIHVIAPASLKNFTQNPQSVSVHLDNDMVLETKLLIGADGRNSTVRQLLGIKPWTWPYNQIAIVGVIQHERPHQNTAFEHFLTQGPLALLPMTGNQSSMVWTLPADKAQAFMALDDTNFNEELQRSFGDRLGRFNVEGARWSYSLNGLYCRQWYKGRAVLVGDACHAIHPVAGQGFNLGLRGAAELTQQLQNEVQLNDMAVIEKMLKAYQRSQRIDSISMTAMTDGLVRLFSNDKHSLNFLRTMGLRITNRIPPLKRILTRHAMGLPRR